jgi:hypothetical protein
MGPTKPTTAAEYKVIRWLFGPALVVAALYVGWSWISATRECTATCRTQGFAGGSLRLNPGSKLDVGSHCECIQSGS